MLLVVNNYFVVLDFNVLFWEGDDPFDVFVAGLGRSFKNNYVASLGLLKFVGYFVG